jgi:hypothetical protein
MLILAESERNAFAVQKQPNWAFGAENDYTSLYIDTNNINNKSNSIKEFWVKSNYKTKEIEAYKDVPSLKNDRSSLMLVEVNCEKESFIRKRLIVYTEIDLKGNSKESPTAGQLKLNPGSILSVAASNLVCK